MSEERESTERCYQQIGQTQARLEWPKKDRLPWAEAETKHKAQTCESLQKEAGMTDIPASLGIY